MPANPRPPRTRSITAAAVTAVLLASALAIAANLGILRSTTNGPVGMLGASDVSASAPQSDVAPVVAGDDEPHPVVTSSCVEDDDHDRAHDDHESDHDSHDGEERYEGRDDDD
jgi:hypothetical protein